jgi:hypothetical protein
MDIFLTIVQRIIKEQELVIGPLAWEEAQKVKGLKIDKKNQITLEGKELDVVDRLVKQYERLFGQASVEVCKDAVKDLVYEMPKDQVPAILK